MGPWMMGGWNGGWGWMGGGISMIIFWALLVVGIVLLVKWTADSRAAPYCGTHGEESAEDILKRRYARGEITKTEFEQARRDLT